MSSVPLRATAVEQELRGQPLDPNSISAAAEQAAEGTEPPADLNATADYKRHLARVLTKRALTDAAALRDAPGRPRTRGAGPLPPCRCGWLTTDRLGLAEPGTGASASRRLAVSHKAWSEERLWRSRGPEVGAGHGSSSSRSCCWRRRRPPPRPRPSRTGNSPSTRGPGRERSTSGRATARG